MHYVPPVLLGLALSLSLVSAQGDLEKLPAWINSDHYDETTPVLSRKGDKLFFTRTAYPDFDPTIIDEFGQIPYGRQDEQYIGYLSMIYSQIAGEKIPDPVSSAYNQDIWYAPLYGDSIGEVIHPGYPLNNALPNSLVSTGMLPDEYILINQFYKDGSMYEGFSRVYIGPDGRYDFPEPMHIYEFDVISSNVNMTMTPNGHVLILSLERSDSKGKNDLYVSFYVRENLWSAPIHIQDHLNTSYQETTPFVSPDKRYLYFSSDRPGGVGGNDIYVAERLDYSWLRWSPPVLLAEDVNSIYDDSQPYFDPEARYMYFTSKRDGSSDIYRKRLSPRPRLKTPIFIKGKIVNTYTGQPTRAELFWGQQSSQDYLEYFNSYNGHFEMLLTEYEPYKFQARKPNHTAQRIHVDPRWIEMQDKDTVEIILYLSPNRIEDMIPDFVGRETMAPDKRYGEKESLPGNQGTSFYNIHFVKGKATMLRQSSQALQYLLQVMTENPELEILVEGHTDNVGIESDLIDLSLARAQAIRDYLVKYGISRDRIRVIGLGATQPLSQNITEEGRKMNRRVEISIIKL
jgi:outer membrane protein OmpA-like peptidoglycan-associated protein